MLETFFPLLRGSYNDEISKLGSGQVGSGVETTIKVNNPSNLDLTFPINLGSNNIPLRRRRWE